MTAQAPQASETKYSETAPLTKAELRNLSAEEAFRDGLVLLERAVLVDTSEGQKQLKITAVEPFSCLLKAQDKRAFEAKSRAKGEVFMTWYIANPFLNIVVDPDTQSVVCIKEVEIDGRRISNPQAILAELGIDRSKFDDGKDGFRPYKDQTMQKLDGLQTHSDDPSQDIRIAELAETTSQVLEIRRVTNAKIAQNSLGIFVN